MLLIVELLCIYTLCCREPGAEEKFKEISNAYEVNTADPYACLVVIDLL